MKNTAPKKLEKIITTFQHKANTIAEDEDIPINDKR